MKSASQMRTGNKLEQLLGSDMAARRRTRRSRPEVVVSNATIADARATELPEAGMDEEARRQARPRKYATEEERENGQKRQRGARREARQRLQGEIDSMLMSIQETAAYMRLSDQTIYDDANADLLPTIKRGKRILIVKPLLERMILAEAIKRWKGDPLDQNICPHCGHRREDQHEPFDGPL